jgi:hypothetical protein
MTAIRVSVFDVTPDMLPIPRGSRERRFKPEFYLVRGHIRDYVPSDNERDSYGIPLKCRRQRCPRCGIRYTTSNPIADPGRDDNCRDCAEVVALIRDLV